MTEQKPVEKCLKCGTDLSKEKECAGGTLDVKKHKHCPKCHRQVRKD